LDFGGKAEGMAIDFISILFMVLHSYTTYHSTGLPLYTLTSSLKLSNLTNWHMLLRKWRKI